MGGYTFEIDGRRMAWTETGDPAGPVLLLLHAFPLHSGMWQPLLDSPPAGWRVVAPDLPGFGSSDCPHAAFSMDDAADDVAALLAHLGVAYAAVAGLSLGGYVAFALLRRHPARVRALILCDTRAEADTDEIRRGRHVMAARIRKEGIAPLVEGMLPRLLAPASRGGDLEARVRSIMEATSPQAAIAAIVGLANRPDSTPMLRSITRTTLLIAGEHDVITPPGEMRLLARAIPGALLEIVPGAGHLPNLEQPVLFNTLVDRFLAGLR